MKLKSVIPFLILFAYISCSESTDDETSSNTDSVTYSVEISAASGGTVDNSGGSFDSGSTLTVTATPNSGYAFINWSDGTTDNPKELNINSNLTLTANFEEAFTVSTEFAELYNSIDGLSTVGDNQILKSGLESVRELDLSDPTGGSTIGFLDDLSGIENFTNLRRLTIDRQSLRNIDLSKNTKLEYIHIWNNKLISINLDGLENLEKIGVGLPNIPGYATNNAHIFYLVCRSQKERINLIKYLKEKQIHAVFHYVCLHDSPYYNDKNDGRKMPNAKRYEECLVRFPLWVNMTDTDWGFVIYHVLEFYKN